MSGFSPRLSETPPVPIPALRWGKSYWHVWDADSGFQVGGYITGTGLAVMRERMWKAAVYHAEQANKRAAHARKASTEAASAHPETKPTSTYQPGNWPHPGELEIEPIYAKQIERLRATRPGMAEAIKALEALEEEAAMITLIEYFMHG